MRIHLIGGRLIDGTGAEPIDGAGLVVDGARIAAVGPVERLPAAVAGSRVIDLDGRTLMPGLIDCHTHLTYHTVEPDVWRLDQTESVELNTLRAAANASHVLGCGFTSIGDGACRGWIAPAVRDAVREGLIAGPDICAAGPMLCGPAGLLDNDPAWVTRASTGALAMLVSGPDEVRRAVRTQIKGGVDWIKVSASGVAGSRFLDAEHDDLGYEEIAAAVDEAARFGKRVHAHAHSRGGVNAAVAAGVVSLHCAEFADEGSLVALRDAGIPFSPTLAWLQARCMDHGGVTPPASFLEEAWRAYAAAREVTVMARELGVPIALGTDAFHRFPHVPDGVIELQYLAALGFEPLEVIRCATATAARAIDLATDRGTLAPGKRADLLVVDGDPATDLDCLRDKARIQHVFKAGVEQPLVAQRARVGVPFEVDDWAHRDLAQTRASPVAAGP